MTQWIYRTKTTLEKCRHGHILSDKTRRIITHSKSGQKQIRCLFCHAITVAKQREKKKKGFPFPEIKKCMNGHLLILENTKSYYHSQDKRFYKACKICLNERVKEYRTRNKEQIKERKQQKLKEKKQNVTTF